MKRRDSYNDKGLKNYMLHRSTKDSKITFLLYAKAGTFLNIKDY